MCVNTDTRVHAYVYICLTLSLCVYTLINVDHCTGVLSCW